MRRTLTVAWREFRHTALTKGFLVGAVALPLLIFLLVPEAATQKHLEILSEIAELLSDSGLREKIKTTDDAQVLHDAIANWQSAQPA